MTLNKIRDKNLPSLVLSSPFLCGLIQKRSEVGNHPSCTGQPEQAEKTSSPVSLQGELVLYIREGWGEKIQHKGKVLNPLSMCKRTNVVLVTVLVGIRWR